MSRSSPEAVLHGRSIRIWVRRLSKRRTNVTCIFLPLTFMGGDNKMLITVKLSLPSCHQNWPLSLLGAMLLFSNGAQHELTTGSMLKRSSWNILMNMLKFFLLDEMFPNVCDKLCKLFSKQKTFNFTQHIPAWKGGKKRYGIRSVSISSTTVTQHSTMVVRSAKRCTRV